MWWLGDTDAWITLGSVEERLRLLLNKEVAEIAVYSENGETLAPFFFLQRTECQEAGHLQCVYLPTLGLRVEFLGLNGSSPACSKLVSVSSWRAR